MIAIYNSKRNKTANGETNARIRFSYKFFRNYGYCQKKTNRGELYYSPMWEEELSQLERTIGLIEMDRESYEQGELVNVIKIQKLN
jgi:hypothetical protein